ncbi:MAG: hypothetical protein JO189_24875 [Deltaproteobacteria bacterium]|nr:hypothetical protein [Deltaproteobacteria bacterium]
MEVGFVDLGKMGMNKKDVVLPVIALSLFTRFHSRVDSEGSGSFAERLLGALRNEFGSHAVVENHE